MKAYIFSKPEIKKEYYLGTEEVKGKEELETTAFREYAKDKYDGKASAAFCFGMTNPKILYRIQKIAKESE